MAEARSAVAALLVADVDDIALAHSTTDGVNVGVWSIDWQAGDRVVTSSGEHPAVTGPLIQLRDRRGVELVVVDPDPDGDEAATLAAFDAALDERTRMVVLSHVLYGSGTRLPLAAIAAAAHERGALVVVDGAQSVGADPGRLRRHGRGRPGAARPEVAPGAERDGRPRRVAPGPRPVAADLRRALHVRAAGRRRNPSLWPNARRFEWSNWYTPGVVGMARSIGWMSMFIGLDWFQTRGPALAAWMAERLAGIEGVTLVTPRAAMATLIAFRIAGWTPQAALDELGARVFAIARTVPDRRRAADQRRRLEQRGRAGAVRDRRGAAGRPHARDAAAPADADLAGRGMTDPAAPAADPAPRLGRGPLAAVPECAPPRRPRGAGQPRRGGRPGDRLCRLRRRARPRRGHSRRRPPAGRTDPLRPDRAGGGHGRSRTSSCPCRVAPGPPAGAPRGAPRWASSRPSRSPIW